MKPVMLFSDVAPRHPDPLGLASRLAQVLHHARQQIENGEHAAAYDDVSDALNILHQLTASAPDWKKANESQIRARLLPLPMLPTRSRAAFTPSFGMLLQRI